jgi:hypothetical protein
VPRHALTRSGLSLGQWLALLPELATLVGEVVAAVRDGCVTEDEALRLGRALLALVGAVVHA